MAILDRTAKDTFQEASTPVLETQRLVLRAPRIEDAKQIAALANHLLKRLPHRQELDHVLVARIEIATRFLERRRFAKVELFRRLEWQWLAARAAVRPCSTTVATRTKPQFPGKGQTGRDARRLSRS